MKTLTLTCAPEEKDRLVAELWERGTAGIVERESPGGRIALEAFFHEAFPAGDFLAWQPSWEPADDTNWARIIMESWEPVLVGRRFFVTPDWRTEATPEGRIRLEVRPGLALGTGYHPTTQMCLEAMERRLRPDDRFLDLGAGSGILSRAAWLLGERRIVACDIDPQAVGAAKENLERSGTPVLLFTGPVQAIAGRAADFLVANIASGPLAEMAPELSRVLSADGRAVLSGFSPEGAPEVREAAGAAGFVFVSGDERDDWACLVFERA